jgi:hypothetical protein
MQPELRVWLLAHDESFNWCWILDEPSHFELRA